MRRVPFILAPLIFAAALGAQPRLTLDDPAIARRLVQQLALKPGERVRSIAGEAVAAPSGRAAYVRWNFFTDLTVTVGSTTWVRNGTLQ